MLMCCDVDLKVRFLIPYGIDDPSTPTPTSFLDMAIEECPVLKSRDWISVIDRYVVQER